MRFAIGTITYWSILAGIFLVGATVIKFRRDAKGLSIEVSADEKENYSRMGKHSPINRRSRSGRPLVVSPEDALSSNLGDSTVTLPNAGQQSL